MLTPDAARAAVTATYDRNAAGWATSLRTGTADGWFVDRPLHPPAERAALADPSGVAAWIAVWRRADPDDGPSGHVVWTPRRWASMGTQVVPERLRLGTPEAVARFAGRTGHWRRATERADRLIAVLGRSPVSEGADGDVLRAAVARVLRAVVDLNPVDMDRLVGVLDFVLTYETGGLFVRQVPVRGVDTKWLERHRRIVDPLYAAASGQEHLDLATRPALLRARFLDPALAPGGVRYLAAPVAELTRLTTRPRVVIVIENLESLLALPDLDGMVAVHGQGYAARVLHQIHWIRDADVVYWGDLDTDGLNILSAVRSHLPQTRSILMDRKTLTAHLDLAVPEPRPRRALPPRLTDVEADAFAALRELGDVRLEQERLPWGAVLTTVDALLAR
ncbi:Wadjet anti-phage system protein JetD domain-containing protein [Cellulosimicrobium cellulans]|uniref:Wadjet anti-phage system protein JetD domain-containing protein n=1 Tax=Cellulosimicrobium cellulans TaxID=1710 RepID=UPI0024073054|nr:Wadjet anti-phage system protein JetD domain-containing protein [Cellulosimicrobium cellulans]MDF9876456.1 hypothetical protein [Cellulosimicrobium cellulans]